MFHGGQAVRIVCRSTNFGLYGAREGPVQAAILEETRTIRMVGLCSNHSYYPSPWKTTSTEEDSRVDRNIKMACIG